MEEVSLNKTREDGEIDETTENAVPALVLDKVEEGANQETTKDEEKKTSKRHKSARSSHDHPCSREAFHDLYLGLNKKGQLGEMPRYTLVV